MLTHSQLRIPSLSIVADATLSGVQSERFGQSVTSGDFDGDGDLGLLFQQHQESIQIMQVERFTILIANPVPSIHNNLLRILMIIFS